jgi:hypothetical protein
MPHMFLDRKKLTFKMVTKPTRSARLQITTKNVQWINNHPLHICLTHPQIQNKTNKVAWVDHKFLPFKTKTTLYFLMIFAINMCMVAYA